MCVSGPRSAAGLHSECGHYASGSEGQNSSGGLEGAPLAPNDTWPAQRRMRMPTAASAGRTGTGRAETLSALIKASRLPSRPWQTSSAAGMRPSFAFISLDRSDIHRQAGRRRSSPGAPPQTLGR